MNCQRNVTSTLPARLPHEFSYMVAILGHNHFESATMYICTNNYLTLFSILNQTSLNSLLTSQKNLLIIKIPMYLGFTSLFPEELTNLKFFLKNLKI
jgi:hypothetical protein